MKMTVAKPINHPFLPANLTVWLKAAFCSAAVVVLASCGSTPNQVRQPTKVIAKPIEQPKVFSSDEYLAMAKQHNDSATYLLNAAQAASNEQNPQKSLL